MALKYNDEYRVFLRHNDEYVCHISGRHAVVDQIHPSEVGLVIFGQCTPIDYHTISLEIFEKYFAEYHPNEDINEVLKWGHVIRKYCPFCRYRLISTQDICDYLTIKFKHPIEDVYNVLKKTNPYKKKVYAAEYLDYVLDAHSLTREMVEKEIRDTFPTYPDLRDFIDGYFDDWFCLSYRPLNRKKQKRKKNP